MCITFVFKRFYSIYEGAIVMHYIWTVEYYRNLLRNFIVNGKHNFKHFNNLTGNYRCCIPCGAQLKYNLSDKRELECTIYLDIWRSTKGHCFLKGCSKMPFVRTKIYIYKNLNPLSKYKREEERNRGSLNLSRQKQSFWCGIICAWVTEAPVFFCCCCCNTFAFVKSFLRPPPLK